MISTIFFLLNRLAKSMIRLSEFERSMKEFERLEKESTDSDEYKSIYENQKTRQMKFWPNISDTLESMVDILLLRYRPKKPFGLLQNRGYMLYMAMFLSFSYCLYIYILN
jgi:hypothetical protein